MKKIGQLKEKTNWKMIDNWLKKAVEMTKAMMSQYWKMKANRKGKVTKANDVTDRWPIDEWRKVLLIEDGGQLKVELMNPVIDWRKATDRRRPARPTQW